MSSVLSSAEYFCKCFIPICVSPVILDVFSSFNLLVKNIANVNKRNNKFCARRQLNYLFFQNCSFPLSGWLKQSRGRKYAIELPPFAKVFISLTQIWFLFSPVFLVEFLSFYKRVKNMAYLDQENKNFAKEGN